jgi:trans-aconitate methyltransferase
LSTPEYIEQVYDQTSREYSERFFHELEHKPFDQILLKAFSEKNRSEKIIDLGCGPGQTISLLK